MNIRVHRFLMRRIDNRTLLRVKILSSKVKALHILLVVFCALNLVNAIYQSRSSQERNSQLNETISEQERRIEELEMRIDAQEKPCDKSKRHEGESDTCTPCTPRDPQPTSL